MKPLFWNALFLMVACAALAQVAPPLSAAKERMFFPRDSVWGWVQFDVAPPHNEPDPNLCRVNSGSFGGAAAPCNAFGRYLISGKIDLRPFGRGPLRRFMLFGEPTGVFGKNVPQKLYTWSMSPIGVERTWGFGIDLGRGFQLRGTQHGLFQRIGSRSQYLGPADLGTNGPWGRYNTVGVRKYFGRLRVSEQ